MLRFDSIPRLAVVLDARLVLHRHRFYKNVKHDARYVQIFIPVLISLNVVEVITRLLYILKTRGLEVEKYGDFPRGSLSFGE